MKDDYSYITMIERGQMILKKLYESENPLGVSEISQKLDLPKATTYRILLTLLKEGYVRKDEEDKYRLGQIFIKYGEKVKDEIDVHTVSKPYIKELAVDTKEAVNLAVDYEEQALILERAEGERTSLVARLIATTPYYCSSSGKIMLSKKPESYIKEYFNKNLEKRTINTITNYKEFMKEKKDIDKLEIAVDNEEYEYGLYCIASPLYSQDKKLIGVVSLSGPKSRMEYKGIEKLRKKLIRQTAKINKEIKKIGIKE